MKNILLTSATCVLSMQLMLAQASGNAVQPNSNAAQAADATANGVFISTVGNMQMAPVNLCSGSSNAVSAGSAGASYQWNNNSQNVNFGGQSRTYYNPYTGQYEDTPNQGNTQAQAALPYDN